MKSLWHLKKHNKCFLMMGIKSLLVIVDSHSKKKFNISAPGLAEKCRSGDSRSFSGRELGSFVTTQNVAPS